MQTSAALPAFSTAPVVKGEAIALKGVSKRFGAIIGVDTVDIDIRAGEFLSLLGPSGSGKTTLLMMLAGFEMPSSGTIALGNRDLTYVPPNKRGIGMVFQRYALFPHMTVAQNVAFPLKMRGVPAAEIGPRVERALALVRLPDYGARLPGQLSGGQQQRVAVARALVFEPPVLLMDEPLGALDKKLREELQIEIKKLHANLGITIIYVTHDQEEALTMSDRIAVMDKGRIQQLGSPAELYHAPKSSFVADFIGKMNFLTGTLRALGDATVEVEVAGRTLTLPRARLIEGSDARVGQKLRLAVRPENIHPADAAPDTLAGDIETAIFLGSHQTLIVRLDDQTPVQVQMPTTVGDTMPRGYGRLSLALDANAVCLFPMGD